MNPRTPTGEIVNRSGLARIMGVSLPTIDSWLTRGCPVISRPDLGKSRAYEFNTAAVIGWRMDQAVRASLTHKETKS
jgi:phage terminase Nu1 subunit (DNA packaging protein)